LRIGKVHTSIDREARAANARLFRAARSGCPLDARC